MAFLILKFKASNEGVIDIEPIIASTFVGSLSFFMEGMK